MPKATGTLGFNQQPHSPKQLAKHAKAEALLAFRTITLMLSEIQSIRRTTGNGLNPEDYKPRPSRDELKILDALAAVTIRKQEMVAVVAKTDRSRDFQVLASASFGTEAFTIPQPIYRNFMDGLWSLLTTQTLPSPFGSPIMVDPEANVPHYLKDCTNDPDGLVAVFITREWTKSESALADLGSFAIHMWMIGKLLGQSAQHEWAFSAYVIAACYRKMLMRMTYRTSASFLDALKKVQNFEFGDVEHEASHSESALDGFFLSKLRKLTPGPKTPIAKLISGPDHHFYTSETCMDFHHLLCELLELFFQALTDLDELHKMAHSLLKDSNRLHKLLPLVLKILEQIDVVSRFGTVLRAMVKGASMKKHLKTIERFLPDRVALGEREEPSDEEDRDLIAHHIRQPVILHHPRQPKWEMCSDWLELMVIYFDAMQVLARFVKLRDPVEVDIKILRHPPSGLGSRMLPWKEVLQHRKYFPKVPSHPSSVAEIIEFLDSAAKSPSFPFGKCTTSNGKSSGVTGEVVVELVMALDQFNAPIDESAFTSAVDAVIFKMGELTNCTSPGSGDYTQIILKKLNSLKNMWVLYSPGDRTKQLNEITEMIKTLRDNAKMFEMLKPGTPLSTGDGYKGMCHGPIFLAAFCAFEASEYGNAIGVSKRCCPVCAYLLSMLRPSFIFTAAHNTISPCSLPESLPLDVIFDMIAMFGGQLRRELCELKAHTEILQSCAQSIGSRRLSLDSALAQIDFERKPQQQI